MNDSDDLDSVEEPYYPDFHDDYDVHLSPQKKRFVDVLKERKTIIIIAAILILAIIIIISFVTFVTLIVVLLGSSDVEHSNSKYGVVVDLGSSGSRIHVFEWTEEEPVQPAPHGGDGGYWFMEQKPGVSSYATNPTQAGPSLEPLLNYAVDKLNSVSADIPNTPIFLFATAGLRLIASDESAAILDSIRKEISHNYEFLFENDWAQIITGTQEATYDWLSIQQIILIESFYDESFKFYEYPTNSVTSTIGVIDLGGGSVEVSFSPTDSQKGSDLNSDEFVTLEFDSADYDIYGHSYLGFGHNSARTGYEAILVQSTTGSTTTISDPCAVSGSSTWNVINNVNYTFVGKFDVQKCILMIESLIDKSVQCNYTSCSFLGVYQPLVLGTNFVGLDDLAEVTNFLGVPANPALTDILSKSTIYCSMSWSQIIAKYPDQSPSDLDKYCFEGLYIYELLTYGYGFSPNSQQILFAETLYGIELSWALGAMTSEVAINQFQMNESQYSRILKIFSYLLTNKEDSNNSLKSDIASFH